MIVGQLLRCLFQMFSYYFEHPKEMRKIDPLLGAWTPFPWPRL